jgi:hypothetical protein
MMNMEEISVDNVKLGLYDNQMNLPSEDEIEKLKKEAAPNEIHAISIAGTTYIFRDLNRGEYYSLKEQMATAENPEQVEELIIAQCLIKPMIKDVKLLKAGIPSVIADAVFLVSGFEPTSAPVKL